MHSFTRGMHERIKSIHYDDDDTQWERLITFCVFSLSLLNIILRVVVWFVLHSTIFGNMSFSVLIEQRSKLMVCAMHKPSTKHATHPRIWLLPCDNKQAHRRNEKWNNKIGFSVRVLMSLLFFLTNFTNVRRNTTSKDEKRACAAEYETI